MRERMDQHRMRSGIDQSPCVVVEVTFGRRAEASHAAAELDAVTRFSSTYWIHAQELGWISDRVLGILLPNASAEDGVAFADRLIGVTKIAARNVRVLTTDREAVAKSERRARMVKVGLLSSIFARKTPLWKRSMDIAGASLALLVTSPIMLIAAILIRFTSAGPVFFRQRRIGLGGIPFVMYKLRTMYADAEDRRCDLHALNERDGLAFKIIQDPRITPVGRWLRVSSLDELPQLINVLMGDMSLVGPRPLPVEDWKPESGWHTVRHDVVPGLTCTWQVSGRNDIPFERWMLMDLDYVRNRSLITDVILLLRTIPAVITRKGAA